MLKLRYPDTTPQGYWRVRRDFGPPQPSDTQADYVWGGDLRDLINEVLKYRVANNLDIENVEARVQDWICRYCAVECMPANVPRQKGPLTLGKMALNFLYAMGTWMAHGGHVDAEEAERRAAICAECPNNTELDNPGCFGCAGIAAKIASVIGDRKTKVDGSLRWCNVCGCSCAVQAWVPMDVLARVHNFNDFQLPCWKRAYAESQKGN